MTFFNIIVGGISILMFIFLIFPSSLKEVLKWDPYKLGVLCVFILCLAYWLSFFIRRFKKPVRVIKNPQGYYYLIEGKKYMHIPDAATFNYLGSYFGFSWADAREMPLEEINRKFNPGRALPSIVLNCPKSEN